MEPNDHRDVVVPLADLPGRRGDLTGRFVQVEGAYTLRGRDCSGIECEELSFAGGTSVLRWFLPKRRGPTLEACDFSRLRTPHLDFEFARFHGCLFYDVDVQIGLGTAVVELVDNSFSGRVDGNVSCGPGRVRVRVEGNDFRGVTGIGFMDGVDWRRNLFDIGGRHLILTRDAAVQPESRQLLETTPRTGVLAASLRGEGPLALGQDWALLHREDVPGDLWSLLVERLAPSSSHPQEGGK